MIDANIGRYLRKYIFFTESDRVFFISINEQLLAASRDKNVDKAVSLLNKKIEAVIAKIPDPLIF